MRKAQNGVHTALVGAQRSAPQSQWSCSSLVCMPDKVSVRRWRHPSSSLHPLPSAQGTLILPPRVLSNPTPMTIQPVLKWPLQVHTWAQTPVFPLLTQCHASSYHGSPRSLAPAQLSLPTLGPASTPQESYIGPWTSHVSHWPEPSCVHSRTMTWCWQWWCLFIHSSRLIRRSSPEFSGDTTCKTS